MVHNLKVGWLIAALFANCFYSTSQNIIKNGSFSDGMCEWYPVVEKDLAKATFKVIPNDDARKDHLLSVHVSVVDTGYWAFKFHHVNLSQEGFGVERYDVYKLSCRVKGKGKDLLVQAGFARKDKEKVNFWELNDHAMVNIPVDSNWQYHEIPLIISETTDNVKFALRFGEKTGTYYIDDIKLIKIADVKNQHRWMARADARIDSLRKGDFNIVITDGYNRPINGALMHIKLASHKFMWGTSVYWVTPGRWNRKRYRWERKEILKTFNTIVNEDDFKWPQMEPKQGRIIYENVDLYAKWAAENNIRMRGHCLVWPKQGVYLPKWFEALPEREAKEALKTRIQREMNYYEGKMCEYDVLNEPVHNPFLGNWLGDTIYHDMFTWARKADPSAGLYVNEWWNFDYWDHYRFRAYVDSLLTQNTPLDGLGLQGHMDRPFNWLQFKFKLDYLAEAGLPLKITEFDVNVDRLNLTLEEQARYYSDMMHLVFSHPAIDGFLIWGLTDGWRDNAGIYNDDFTPRPAADMMQHLIKKKWHTNEKGETDIYGSFAFRGFKGEYEVTIKKGDKEKCYRISLDSNNPSIKVKF